jgi:NAD(P)H dehydrogenase (quinone)
MENILHSIPAARSMGMYFAFYQPLEHPIPLVATEDIGRIGTETLLQTWQGNRFIEISGPTYYSPNDVAAALEKALDRPSPALRFRERRGSISWHSMVCQRTVPAPTSR